MEIAFTKYQGAGNDFIMIDNRGLIFPKDNIDLIHKMCDRRFGIGADGLILLEDETSYDFRMVYYNADGKESSMCGNGGRCIVAFAKELGIIESKANFIAIDGPHDAEIREDGKVSLGMIDVAVIEEVKPNHYFLNTGSPHYVVVLDELPEDIITAAREIRNSPRFKKEGVNVNFIKISANKQVQIRTYERGVEAETLACGTGSVAAGIIAHRFLQLNEHIILTKGGLLEVKYESGFTQVRLIGAAVKVFEGMYN